MTTPKTQRQHPAWLRHVVYRKESWKTTWKFRFAVLAIAAGLVLLTSGIWTTRLGRSLVCSEHAPPSDALLLENFDPDYLVFERAETLRRSGVASRILVPLSASNGQEPNAIEVGVADLMAKVAHVPEIEGIPIQLKEPISLNAAYQIRDFLKQKSIRSIVVVAPGFRSRRSAMVYSAVLEPAHISVGCVPVFGKTTPENWAGTTHGIQGVLEQSVKLLYYGLYQLR